ncbi:hypothetical protein GCM10010156_37160 [Planobispora rosea]|uniref:Type IV pilus assembly protein PilO n=1 Tax=Planobispora rosea TaxID=35762 RepID=A0A8J3RRU0_PLARO|nr:type 4a pilus biogenesis protein PilO [Planobispora rosea]GGS74918.1 hypothetical protein GCM10010156_37160 [Planobispora rosea]GIH81791.1 hypothetical protein Pro02_01990 [Planobispora rosea]
MLTGRADRVWILGGILVAAVLLAVGWFFFISPQHEETDTMRAEAESTQVRAATLRSRLAELSQENVNLPKYRAELKAARQALPTTAQSEGFLDQLRQAGEAATVSVDGINIGGATEVTAGDVKMHALPVAVTATGSTAGLDTFFEQLQRVQPRAVLIDNVTIDGRGEESQTSEMWSLVVNMNIFVAAPTGK